MACGGRGSAANRYAAGSSRGNSEVPVEVSCVVPISSRTSSPFRVHANAAKLIDRVRETGRPLVLTQRGHSAAVVLDVEEYEHLLEEVELLKDIQLAEKQLQAGKGVSNRKAKESSDGGSPGEDRLVAASVVLQKYLAL